MMDLDAYEAEIDRMAADDVSGHEAVAVYLGFIATELERAAWQAPHRDRAACLARRARDEERKRDRLAHPEEYGDA